MSARLPLGQHLVLIRNLALLPRPKGDYLTRLADQAAVAIQEVETISYDLRPYQPDRLGLTKTLLSLVETFQSSSPVQLTHRIDNIDGFFSPEMEIHVYRIVQEALANILRHAEATDVTVTVARIGAALQLVVADNGRGFAHSATRSTAGGPGIVGIEERAEALGGRAVIESADRAGTKITVTVTRSDQRQGAKDVWTA